MTTQREINRLANHFNQKTINEKIQPPKIICQGNLFKGGGGGGPVSTTWATVIVAPTNPDPEADPESPEYAGINYYICRLLTDTTPAYDGGTPYLEGDVVIDLAGFKYISLQGTVEDPNIGNLPEDSPEWWERSEEIKIEEAIGFEDTGYTLNNFSPRFAVGQVIPIISRVVGETTKWFINMTLIYTGLPADASIRQTGAKGDVTSAVYT